MKSKQKQIAILCLLFTLFFILPLQAQPLQQWIGNINPKDPIYRTGPVGINNNNPREMLEIGGRIRLGDNPGSPPEGTIRWYAANSDFEGYTSTGWKSMTSKWNTSGNNIINTNTGNVQLGLTSNLGIGRAPNSKLDIYSVDPGSSWMTGLQLTAHYTGETPTDKQTFMVQRSDGFYIKSDGGYNFMNTLGTVNFMHISSDGNIGIGITNPTAKLEINEGIFINSVAAGNDLFKIATVSTENLPTVTSGSHITYKSGRLALGKYVDDQIPIGVEEDDQPEDPMGSVSERIVFDAFGVSYLWYTTGLAIGKKTIIPGYKLDVQGKIRANEIVVNTTGSDFVFENDYNMKSLDEVETFIKENKHLPDIPTAKEVEENGVSLGEMQTKLLQKIEELTLYVIELKKENEVLKAKVNELDKR